MVMDTPLERVKMLARELELELDAPLKEAARRSMVTFKTKLIVEAINIIREAYNLDLYLTPVGRGTYIGTVGQAGPYCLTCPRCQQPATVYHLDWSALVCPNCQAEVLSEEWDFAPVSFRPGTR